MGVSKVMEVIKATTESRVDIVRATNTTKTVQNVEPNKVLTLKEIIIYKTHDDNEDKDVEVTALKVEDNSESYFINSISKTVKQSVEVIMSLFSDEDIKAGIPIKVESDTSKGGRTFYHIDLVE